MLSHLDRFLPRVSSYVVAAVAVLILVLLALPSCQSAAGRELAGSGTKPPATTRATTTTTTTTTLPPCPVFTKSKTGQVTDDRLAELSGLVVGRRNPDALWVHNDSGNAPAVYALSTDGALRGTYDLGDISVSDPEDIAIGPAPGDAAPHIYIGDIGTNNDARDTIRVLRFPEPDLAQLGPKQYDTITGITVLEARYPDKPWNAEVLLLDPTTTDLYVITKVDQKPGTLFRWPSPTPGQVAVLEPIRDLDLSAFSLDGTPTGGDVTEDGSGIVVRSYSSVTLWRRMPGSPFQAAFETEPCPLRTPFEQQGEAVGLSQSGDTYYTVSEGLHPEIFSFTRK